MTAFALVHGAWHAGGHFDLLVRELETRGHTALAPDLPSEDPEAGLEAYADTVVAALAGTDDPVLVGHSLGGLTIPLVAARRPVRRLVYLCAFVPVPGRALVADASEALVPGFPAGVERDELRRSAWVDLDAAVRQLYPDCPPAAARAAAERLRPQARAPQVEPWPLDRLPDAPSTSVLCRDDSGVAPGWSRRVARERLGVEALELPGGHSPFLAQPAALADLLESL